MGTSSMMTKGENGITKEEIVGFPLGQLQKESRRFLFSLVYYPIGT